MLVHFIHFARTAPSLFKLGVKIVALHFIICIPVGTFTRKTSNKEYKQSKHMFAIKTINVTRNFGFIPKHHKNNDRSGKHTSDIGNRWPVGVNICLYAVNLKNNSTIDEMLLCHWQYRNPFFMCL